MTQINMPTRVVFCVVGVLLAHLDVAGRMVFFVVLQSCTTLTFPSLPSRLTQRCQLLTQRYYSSAVPYVLQLEVQKHAYKTAS